MDLTLPILDWPWLGLLELLWVVVLSVYILLEGRSPMATIAWLLALAFLPFVGLPIYLVFGPRKLARKRYRRALARSMVASIEGARLVRASRLATAAGADVGDPALSLAEAAVGAGEPPPFGCDEVTLLLRGQDCFDALVADIERAQHHVHLEYYIFEEGKVATRLRDALVARARAGVEVRLLVDALGSASLDRRFLAPLVEAGCEVATFNRIAFANLRPSMLNFRSHRKIVCIDGTIGFVGGMNVQDGHDESVVGASAWRDTHVRLVGDAVAALALVFLEDWTFATGSAPSGEAYVHAPAGLGRHLVQIVASGPDLDATFAIHLQYFAAIAAARDRVRLSTPYFVPDEATMMALTSAARRGVDVRVLLPAEGDHPFVSAAARSHFPALLDAGVRIFAYGPRVLHCKTLVVDRHYAAVGSANFDQRSFKLNFEITAAIFDGEVADALASAFEDDVANSVEVTKLSYKQQGRRSRLYEAVAKLFSPIL